MLPPQQWARAFSIDQDDIEQLTGLLLERETPLSTEDLARALIQQRIDEESARLKKRYKDARIYNPSQSYTAGQRLIFTEFEYETALVKGVRPGNNPDYGPFSVIAVEFDNEELNVTDHDREFAAELITDHVLSENVDGEMAVGGRADLTVESVMAAAGKDIIAKLEKRLRANNDLIHMAQKWFPRDLLMDVNVGHLNLSEAVLDICGGGPLHTVDILKEIGGLGKAPMELQVFSMNYALNKDSRFDEVGPSGDVLWHLTRLEPPEVQQTPAMLRYTTIEYDEHLLSPEMLALETEIDDELSDLDADVDPGESITVTLNYPHRRLGTLPLSARTSAVFPTARQTPRVWFTLLDGQDGEEFPAWVVRKEKYIFGLAKFYRKHKLPVGAYVMVARSDEPGKVLVDFKSYKPRTEWIRLIQAKNDQITFENQKRGIGAEYDELMILGADDLTTVDAAFQAIQQQKRSLVWILRSIIPSLGALTPQGTVHAKTLYSAVNVVRRCPPGPIFATLVANPDFENVGGHYWKLRN